LIAFTAAAAAAAAGSASQLENLLADMRDPTEAARSKLQQQLELGRPAAAAGRLLPSSSSGSGRLQRSSIALSYEAEGSGSRRSGSGLGLSRSAAAAAPAAAENEIIGPAHLVQKHKLRQLAAAGDSVSDAAEGAKQQQQQQQQQGKSKQPLKMGQFLKTWNSTQLEQQKQQQQQQAQRLEQQQQEQKQPVKQQQQLQQREQKQLEQLQHRQDQQVRDQQQQQQQQQQQETAAAAAAPAMDPKSFFKLLHEQLQPQQMATVKGLLTAYKCVEASDYILPEVQQVQELLALAVLQMFMLLPECWHCNHKTGRPSSGPVFLSALNLLDDFDWRCG
jgi:DNA polymerase III gamma/tau subunit